MRHLEIARELRPPHFEHHFLCVDASGPVADALGAAGVGVTRLGPVGSVMHPSRYWAGVKLARRWRPTLVHGAVMEGMVLGAVIGRALRLPVITEETSDPQNRRPWGHRLARLADLSAARCVAVSPAVGRYLTEQLSVPSSKVQVVPNGVRRPAPLGATEGVRVRKTIGLPEHAVVVGTVSRLFDDHKRVTDLIRAFNMLAKPHPNLHLIIVGSGPDQVVMEDVARLGGFSERVHFVGRQIPADPFYGLMDIFCLASSREAFGLVVAEAMRAGLPVVATGVGGVADVVQDGLTGYLVQPGEPSQLAEAIGALVAKPQLRKRMGSAGRQRADELYSAERYVRDIEHLYRDLVGVAVP
jgi:L-malate glycosyltransferase